MDRVFSKNLPENKTKYSIHLHDLEISSVAGYRIFSYSFRGNYSFLDLALFTVTFDLYFINLNSCRGNYSREETIQGRKLFAEIQYMLLVKKTCIKAYEVGKQIRTDK